MNSGILGLPIPETKAPPIEYEKIDDFDHSLEDIAEALKSTNGIEASQYYGCWRIWKTEKGFSGELLQYRSVTDEFEGLSFEEALDKAEEWFRDCCG
jgi:hypothetical protein